MKRRLVIIDRILEVLSRSKSCAVVGHVRPDGDCVGSQLALTQALLRQGKRVVCCNEDPLPAKFSFLDPDQRFTAPPNDNRFDCVIAVDCASRERLGRAGQVLDHDPYLINIDHHTSNSRYGNLNWVAPNRPSAGELVVQLLRQARWTITPAMADCLYAAISTDTGSFQYASTTSATLRLAAELIDAGADLSRITTKVYQASTLARTGLLQRLYQRIRFTHHHQIASFHLQTSDYRQTGADRADTEGLIDHLRDIDTVVVACLFEEVGTDVTRISLRSKDPAVDVNAIANRFGGGGHPAAAGARIEGRPAQVQDRVLRAIKRALTSLPASA